MMLLSKRDVLYAQKYAPYIEHTYRFTLFNHGTCRLLIIGQLCIVKFIKRVN